MSPSRRAVDALYDLLQVLALQGLAPSGEQRLRLPLPVPEHDFGRQPSHPRLRVGADLVDLPVGGPVPRNGHRLPVPVEERLVAGLRPLCYHLPPHGVGGVQQVHVASRRERQPLGVGVAVAAGLQLPERRVQGLLVGVGRVRVSGGLLPLPYGGRVSGPALVPFFRPLLPF